MLIEIVGFMSFFLFSAQIIIKTRLNHPTNFHRQPSQIPKFLCDIFQLKPSAVTSQSQMNSKRFSTSRSKCLPNEFQNCELSELWERFGL